MNTDDDRLEMSDSANHIFICFASRFGSLAPCIFAERKKDECRLMGIALKRHGIAVVMWCRDAFCGIVLICFLIRREAIPMLFINHIYGAVAIIADHRDSCLLICFDSLNQVVGKNLTGNN